MFTEPKDDENDILAFKKRYKSAPNDLKNNDTGDFNRHFDAEADN